MQVPDGVKLWEKMIEMISIMEATQKWNGFKS